jgi:septum formation protein
MNLPIILASSSPRRLEILSSIGPPPLVIPSTFPEDLSLISPSEYVLKTATSKGQEVSSRPNLPPHSLLISADIIVVSKNNDIIEKPYSLGHAREILKMLSDTREHTVMTAVVLFVDGVIKTSFVEKTTVIFGKIDEGELEKYLLTGDWEGKAGGYGYQSLGKRFVERIEGDYWNVVFMIEITKKVGFPLYAYLQAVKEIESKKE